MKLFVVGINHKTAPIDLREKFSITQEKYHAFNTFLSNHKGLHEQVTLSTCNRTEVYGVTEDVDDAFGHAKTALSRFSDLLLEACEESLYFKEGDEVVKHLFGVASGLDSMAIGETEILGQVKDAYLKAQTHGLTRKVLNTLFQRSLKVGKKVRTETEIGLGKVSVASIAVDLSKKIFEKLQTKTVLLVGSGPVARQVCEALVSSGLSNIIIANRNQERAEALVEEFGGRAIAFEEMDRWVPQTDIVITSAGSPKAFIHKDRVEQWMHHKDRKALFVIDLGVPRNVDDNVNDVSDVYLYNLDNLQTIAGHNKRGRETAVQACQEIIDRQAEHFMEWFRVELTHNRIPYETLRK